MRLPHASRGYDVRDHDKALDEREQPGAKVRNLRGALPHIDENEEARKREVARECHESRHAEHDEEDQQLRRAST